MDMDKATNQWLCVFNIHYWAKWIDIEDSQSTLNHNHQYRKCLDCGIERKRCYYT